MCDAWIRVPSGSRTINPLLTFCLCVHGLFVNRKCPVHPESAMAVLLGSVERMFDVKSLSIALFATFQLHCPCHSSPTIFFPDVDPPIGLALVASFMWPGFVL